MAESPSELVYMEGDVLSARQVDIHDKPATERFPARKGFSYGEARLAVSGVLSGSDGLTAVVKLTCNVDKLPQLPEGKRVGVWAIPTVARRQVRPGEWASEVAYKLHAATLVESKLKSA